MRALVRGTRKQPLNQGASQRCPLVSRESPAGGLGNVVKQLADLLDDWIQSVHGSLRISAKS